MRTQLSIAALRNGTDSTKINGGVGLDNPAFSSVNGTYQLDYLRSENDQKSKEVYLLKKTLEEMELRIETQKQTLTAKDQSIQKLLEMLQAKGLLENEAPNSFFLVPNGDSNQVGNLESTIMDLKSQVNQKNREISKLKTHVIKQSSVDLETRLKSPPPFGLSSSQEPTAQAIKEILESKDEKIEHLEKQLQSNSRFNRSELDRSENLGASSSYKEHIEFLKSKIDQLRTENSKRETENLASQSKQEVLMKQNTDQSQHIKVLKEALFTKDQHVQSLQNEIDSLKGKIDERELLLNKRKAPPPLRQSSFSDVNPDYKDKRMSEMQRVIDSLKGQIEILKLHQGQNATGISTAHSELQSVFGDREKLLEQLRHDSEKQKFSYDNQLDSYSRLNDDVNKKNHELNQDNQIKSKLVRDHEEKMSSLLTANMKKVR